MKNPLIDLLSGHAAGRPGEAIADSQSLVKMEN
jgi:hypothetical protein